jgi:hypothetical protein
VCHNQSIIAFVPIFLTFVSFLKKAFIKERGGAALREALLSRPLSSFLFESAVRQKADPSTHAAVKAVVPELEFIPPNHLLVTREFPKLLHVLQTDRQQWGNLISSINVPIAKANPDRYSEFVSATALDAPILSPALPAPGNLSFTQSELIATSTHLAHSVGFAVAERVLFVTSNADTVALALQLAAVQSGATLVYAPNIEDAMAQSDLHHCTTMAASVSTLGSIDLQSEAIKRVNKVIIVGTATPDVAKVVTALEARGISVFLVQ